MRYADEMTDEQVTRAKAWLSVSHVDRSKWTPELLAEVLAAEKRMKATKPKVEKD